MLGLLLTLTAFAAVADAGSLDLRDAVIVTQGEALDPLERTAVRVLTEEVARRTGIAWPAGSRWPSGGTVIVVASGAPARVAGRRVPREARPSGTDAYALHTERADGRTTVWVVGADPRGALYGVGRLLRALHWEDDAVWLPSPLSVQSAPTYPIRGHQLGYRATANSYDAWTPAQYEQYIRELTFFGVNAIENIPFQDQDSPVMPVSREVMNRAMSEICANYGLEYWAWTPAVFDLDDAEKRSELLDSHEAFYKECVRLDAVFFPGGDPGRNHPNLVMPFLVDAAARLAKHHPKAKVWMSLQGFDAERVDYFFTWLHEHQPDWFGGAVGGPGSPPLEEIRRRLPARYALRDYPDITHTVRSQYPTPWIDPAFAFTLGREGVNPEPVYYGTIQAATAPYTDGFITYSDGVHDNVNKVVWSAGGWEREPDLRAALVEYGRLFHGPALAEAVADGLYALERNWSGPLAVNGGVEATLALWQRLEAAPALTANWRGRMHLMRAYYDAYTRHRLLHESALEAAANEALGRARDIGSDAAMDEALAILARADSHRVRADLRDRVVALCEDLFDAIGLQTSVEGHHASGPERGAVLDFLDHPLNNRWWLEDQFAEIRALPRERDKVARLDLIRTWENPGPGSHYDDIGNVAKSPRVIRGEGLNTDPHMVRNPNPDFMWWDGGKSRLRPSWISKMDWPLGLRYEHLDPAARYTLRTTGYGQCLLNANGRRLSPALDGRGIGEFKTFPVPPELYADGTLLITFDKPHEPGINWREQSRLTEVWLLRE